MKLNIVILGLSFTSSWGNGHATTYRGLIRQLAARGHKVLFLERDLPWYAENRDFSKCSFCKIGLYRNLKQLQVQFGPCIREADVVIVGSYVPEGTWISEWVTRCATGIVAFYDIDTPVTLRQLERGDCDYLSAELIPEFDLYLSFTGGPTLRLLENKFSSPMARALYCSADPDLYFPQRRPKKWALGYIGTYSADRQPGLQALLLDAANLLPKERFVVAGPQYPDDIAWPRNVRRFIHLPPNRHRAFYNEQKFTLNLTRADMKQAGFSPSVRLFEAAACGTPIISDTWEGLDDIFEPGREILLSSSAEDTMHFLELPSAERKLIASRARQRVLAEHTAAQRAVEFENYIRELSPRRLVGGTNRSGKQRPSPNEILISRAVL